MNSNLLVAASKVIPHAELLVNVVSRRVRHLNQGHRPLVAAPPGMGFADIALTEIIEGKLTSQPAEKSEVVVATFPGVFAGMNKAA
jgi:DNA-directed RNA polymerase subunit omega